MKLAQIHVIIGDHFQIAQRIMPEFATRQEGQKWLEDFWRDTKEKAAKWPESGNGEALFVPPGSDRFIPLVGVDGDSDPNYVVDATAHPVPMTEA